MTPGETLLDETVSAAMNDPAAGESPAGMTLYERAVELTARVRELKEVQSGARRGSVLEERNRHLQSDAESFASVLRTVQALHHFGMPPAADPAFVTKSLRQWQSIRAAQASDPRYLTSPQGVAAYRDQRRFLQQLIENLRTTSRRSWEKFAAGLLPEVDETLLESLERIPRFAQDAASLRTKIERLRQDGRTLPRSADEITQFRTRCQAMQEQWAALNNHEVPAEVLEFFAQLKVRQGHVPLSFLTASVRQWLEAEGIGDHFYVGYVSAG